MEVWHFLVEKTRFFFFSEGCFWCAKKEIFGEKVFFMKGRCFLGCFFVLFLGFFSLFRHYSMYFLVFIRDF